MEKSAETFEASLVKQVPYPGIPRLTTCLQGSEPNEGVIYPYMLEVVTDLQSVDFRNSRIRKRISQVVESQEVTFNEVSAHSPLVDQDAKICILRKDANIQAYKDKLVVEPGSGQDNILYKHVNLAGRGASWVFKREYEADSDEDVSGYS